MADIDSNLPVKDITDGTPGAAAPTLAEQIAGVDGSGNLRVLSTDSNGVLNQNNATDYSGTGAISALNATVVAQTNGCSTVIFRIVGTWVATIGIEGSLDGVVFDAIPGINVSVGTWASSITAPALMSVPCGGFHSVRVIASAYSSGTANITWNAGAGTDFINQGVPMGLIGSWPIKISDGVNGPVAVKNASTAAVAADKSVVVSLSPNNPIPTGTNTIGSLSNISGTISLPTGAATAANQTNASQKSQIVDGSGNVISATTNSLNVNVTNSFAAGLADKSTFTYGTSIVSAIGGAFQDTSPTLTAGQSGVVRLTSFRGMHHNLRDNSGNEIGISGNPLRIDPTGTTPQPASQSGTWTVQQGATPTAVANAWPVKLTDGTNTAAVKAASTAAVAPDPSAVVALSPNSPLPTGTNTIGSITNISGTISLPTGAATSALQTTGNTSLSSIDGKTPTFGQKTMANSSPVVIASDQSSIPTTIVKVSLTGSAPSSVSVGVASGVVIAANAARKGLVLTNTSTLGTVSFNIAAGSAVLNSGITLYPRGVWVMDEYTFTTAAINGIASLAATGVAIQELA